MRRISRSIRFASVKFSNSPSTLLIATRRPPSRSFADTTRPYAPTPTTPMGSYLDEISNRWPLMSYARFPGRPHRTSVMTLASADFCLGILSGRNGVGRPRPRGHRVRPSSPTCTCPYFSPCYHSHTCACTRSDTKWIRGEVLAPSSDRVRPIQTCPQLCVGCAGAPRELVAA
jgi:hypothetical protein